MNWVRAIGDLHTIRVPWLEPIRPFDGPMPHVMATRTIDFDVYPHRSSNERLLSLRDGRAELMVDIIGDVAHWRITSPRLVASGHLDTSAPIGPALFALAMMAKAYA